jgi:hypothetical protein
MIRADQSTQRVAQKEPTTQPAVVSSNGQGVGTFDGGNSTEPGDACNPEDDYGEWDYPPVRNRLLTNMIWATYDSLDELQGGRLGGGWGGEWFNWHGGEQQSPEPLENNFDDSQRRWRSRDAGERARIRFDVHLWSTIKWRKDAYPQVVAELRKMAEFLIAKADAVQALVEVKRPFADRVEAKGDRHVEIMDVKAAVAMLDAREAGKAVA